MALLVAKFYTFFIPVVRRVDFLIFLELSLSVLVSDQTAVQNGPRAWSRITRAIFHAIYQPPFFFTLQWLHDVFHFEWRLPNCQRNAWPACPCASVCPCSETVQIALMQQQEPIPDLLHEESLLSWNPFCSWYLSQESSARKLYWKLLSSLRIGFILSYVFSYLSLFYFASIIYQRQL